MGDHGDLAQVIAALARALSDDALKALRAALEAGVHGPSLGGAHGSSGFGPAVAPLVEAWDGRDPDGAAVAMALRAAREVHAQRPRIEVVWTGPKSDAVSVRRTDQALADLIRHAQKRLIVTSFAVYKVANVRATLAAAAARGVQVDLIFETVESSGGKISFDGWKELEGDGMRVWTWSLDRRPVTASGSYATLHAKCAVADARRLLVSSANLTDFALSVNMELGLLLDRSSVAARVARHFDALMERGDIVRV